MPVSFLGPGPSTHPSALAGPGLAVMAVQATEIMVQYIQDTRGELQEL